MGGTAPPFLLPNTLPSVHSIPSSCYDGSEEKTMDSTEEQNKAIAAFDAARKQLEAVFGVDLHHVSDIVDDLLDGKINKKDDDDGYYDNLDNFTG
jgi:hypothetical protein